MKKLFTNIATNLGVSVKALCFGVGVALISITAIVTTSILAVSNDKSDTTTVAVIESSITTTDETTTATTTITTVPETTTTTTVVTTTTAPITTTVITSTTLYDFIAQQKIINAEYDGYTGEAGGYTDDDEGADCLGGGIQDINDIDSNAAIIRPTEGTTTATIHGITFNWIPTGGSFKDSLGRFTFDIVEVRFDVTSNNLVEGYYDVVPSVVVKKTTAVQNNGIGLSDSRHLLVYPDSSDGDDSYCYDTFQIQSTAALGAEMYSSVMEPGEFFTVPAGEVCRVNITW